MKTTNILKKAIDEIKADPMIKQKDDDQIIMTELCNKIQVQENLKLTKDQLDFLDEHGPSGVAVFLTVMVPFQRNHKELSYLTLENDALSGWSIAYYIDFGSTGQYKLKKRHDIKSTKPNFIMTEFAKVYKAYLGKEANTL